MSAPRLQRRLCVVRDRARAREVAGGPGPAGGRGTAVWTFAELTERLAGWALLPVADVVRDDGAPLWGVAAALARRDPFLPRIAHDAEELRRALAHGGATAAEVARALSEDATGRVESLRDLFLPLADAERRMGDGRRVDGARALRLAAERLARGELPASLRSFTAVGFVDLLEPTELELACVVAIARAGVSVRVRLPMDSLGRGLLAGVEPVMRSLEAAHDAPALELDLDDLAEAEGALGPFVRAYYGNDTAADAPLEVRLAADEAAEARDVAAVVAAWRRAQPHARVAVAVRTVDGAALRLAAAMERHGLSVRVRRQPIADSPAARLLLDVLALARDGAPRDRLLAVLTSAALRGAISSAQGARVHRVLRLAAARTDVEDASRPTGGYRHRLERYRSALEDEGARREVEEVLSCVERALALLDIVPRRASLLEFLDAVHRLARDLLDDGAGLGAPETRAFLEEARAACAAIARPDDGLVALPAFVTLLARALERSMGPAPAGDDDDAVELLSLPELWGRRFHHVVIAGMVEGRMPRTERNERLLGDSDRALVNRALGRRVLRLFDDDPLERGPVSRAQALEPLWMVGALRAAHTSVFLSAPRRDGRGRELAPSTFLLEALRVLGSAATSTRAGTPQAREPSPRDVVVRTASLRARGLLGDADSVGAGVPPDLLAHVDRVARLSRERSRFFARGKTALIDVRSPFAFAVDPARIERVFGSSFGLASDRPLTPTRLEGLAECRMHGFVQHVLKVDVDPPAGNAADARVLGTLAHTVMERFFTERRAARVPLAAMTNADRHRVRALVAEAAAPVLAGRATGHLGAIRAQLAWLETALVRAVSMLARDPMVHGVEPVEFEVQIGARQGDREPSFAGVPMTLRGRDGDRTIWVGGIIDRVDEGPGGRVVIDYKTASASSVRNKARADALFETHFQLLLYLRLLEHHRPTAPETPLHGYLVSLRDGTTSDDVHDVPDLRARLVEDTRPDGLAAGVGRVVLDILEGTLPPDVSDRCSGCRLQRVCRVPLDAESASTLDERDEADAP